MKLASMARRDQQSSDFTTSRPLSSVTTRGSNEWPPDPFRQMLVYLARHHHQPSSVFPTSLRFNPNLHGPVTILVKDGDVYQKTEADFRREAEVARQIQESEEKMSSTSDSSAPTVGPNGPKGRRLSLGEAIDHATAARRNKTLDRLRRYGIWVTDEMDWSTSVRALRKIGKPLMKYLKPVFDHKAVEAAPPDRLGPQPVAYIADLDELLDLIESKLKKPGYWRRAQSLELRPYGLCGLPSWLRNSRQEELDLCERIDADTRLRLLAPLHDPALVGTGALLHIWRGTPVPYYPELRDFYRQPCRPYCALSSRPSSDSITDHIRRMRDTELAGAAKNRGMVARRQCAAYFLGEAPRPRPKPRRVQHKDTLGNELHDSKELDEILVFAELEARRAVRRLSSSGLSSAIALSDRVFDDLWQEAVIVALTETQTDQKLPLSGTPLRYKIRDRLKRELGRLRKRDYHYGEILPDPDRMTADEDASEMVSPTMHCPFATRAAYETTAEERCGSTSDAESTEMTDDSDEPIGPEVPIEGVAIMMHAEEPKDGRVADLAEKTLDERQLVIVVATYEERTQTEIGEKLGCHQSTVQRSVKKIAELVTEPNWIEARRSWSPQFAERVDDAVWRRRIGELEDAVRAVHGMIVVREARRAPDIVADRATLDRKGHPPGSVDLAPSTRYLPFLDASAHWPPFADRRTESA